MGGLLSLVFVVACGTGARRVVCSMVRRIIEVRNLFVTAITALVLVRRKAARSDERRMAEGHG
jgi:hypothetical protein